MVGWQGALEFTVNSWAQQIFWLTCLLHLKAGMYRTRETKSRGQELKSILPNLWWEQSHFNVVFAWKGIKLLWPPVLELSRPEGYKWTVTISWGLSQLWGLEDRKFMGLGRLRTFQDRIGKGISTSHIHVTFNNFYKIRFRVKTILLGYRIEGE